MITHLSFIIRADGRHFESDYGLTLACSDLAALLYILIALERRGVHWRLETDAYDQQQPLGVFVTLDGLRALLLAHGV